MMAESKEDILRRYLDREPRRFHQFDGFANGDELMGRDADGHSVVGGDTCELMHGADVRVLVPADVLVPAAELACLLRKIADWIERGGHNCRADPPQGADTPPARNVVQFPQRKAPPVQPDWLDSELPPF